MSELPQTKRKKINRRPKLRACLVYWDEGKKRFRMTTPKTAKVAAGMKFDALFLLTDVLEKRFLPDIESFQQGMAESEIGMTCTLRGRIGFQDLEKLKNEG